MTTKNLGTVTLVSTLLAGALTGSVAAQSAVALPNAAYFVVNLHYCAPPAITLAATRSVPAGDAAIVYEEVLMGEYGGNCDNFYANEVRPRVYLSDEQS